MKTRPLSEGDRAALEALLGRAPWPNVFHLGALREFGLMLPGEAHSSTWAIGVFDGHELVGALVVLRGTGGIYRIPTLNERDLLDALSEAIHDAVMRGRLALLSGHASQLDALLPLVDESANGRPDRCYFRTLRRDNLALPAPMPGVREPQLATGDDMERLIDFYQHGFYSLAKLPSRAAWRNRLSEQLAFRTLFLIDDDHNIAQ